jgi:choline dehydrogenase
MEYDLVIVGAGSAGCVIASRVTETPARVLLLEAGPDYPDGAIPEDLRNGNNNSYTAHDWGLSYKPRSTSGVLPFPRGKVVGGSSAVNTCIALRGEPDDYDEWARLGGPEWAWDKCLPAFVRLESDRDFGDHAYHGSAGPLPIGRYAPSELQPIQQAFLDACREAGYPPAADHNAPGATGFGPTPLNKVGDRRISMAEAYLAPARSRPNLTVRPHAPVSRVLIDEQTVRGVELEGGERIECANVALCAGAIMTPPVLRRSGVSLPGIGRLLDHPGTIVLMECPSELVDVTSPLMQTCMRTTIRESNDLFVEALSFAGRMGSGRSLVGIAVAAYRSYGAGELGDEIAPALLDDAADLDLIVAGLRVALDIASRSPIAEMTKGIVGLNPGHSDERLREHALRFCGSGYHPSGTAAMGTDPDGGAVCDQYGRVFGVNGLRIADASIMPTCPRANTNIPTVMIGERFGEWLSDELGS